MSNFYRFSAINYYKRPGGGPLTLPMTRSRGKMGDNGLKLVWSIWKPVIERLNLNNKSAVGLVTAKDWGPSKGLDGIYIKWIGLLWPGENIVKIDAILGNWGLVQGITSPYQSFSRATTPWLVHEVFDYNKKSGYGHRAKPVYVPIISGPWWVNLKYLVKM